MGRAAKIAVAAVLGGLFLTLGMMSVVSPPAPGASARQISRADARHSSGAIPRHCRTAAEPDPACDAAWDAKRRRFFGNEE